jgi:hypothetical protein
MIIKTVLLLLLLLFYYHNIIARPQQGYNHKRGIIFLRIWGGGLVLVFHTSKKTLSPALNYNRERTIRCLYAKQQFVSQKYRSVQMLFLNMKKYLFFCLKIRNDGNIF